MTNKTEKLKEKPAEKLAVIETGGKQYLVRPGDKIKIERLKKPEKGTTVVFDKVLLLTKGADVKIGTPYLEKAEIRGEWLAEKRAKTVISMKYKSKTRQSRRQGHRQIYTEVLISDF